MVIHQNNDLNCYRIEQLAASTGSKYVRYFFDFNNSFDNRHRFHHFFQIFMSFQGQAYMQLSNTNNFPFPSRINVLYEGEVVCKLGKMERDEKDKAAVRVQTFNSFPHSAGIKVPSIETIIHSSAFITDVQLIVIMADQVFIISISLDAYIKLYIIVHKKNNNFYITFQLIGGSAGSIIGPRHNWKRFNPIPENVETAWTEFKVITHLLTTADSFK